MNNEGGPTPLNTGAGVAKISINEARSMMQDLLEQHRVDFRNLLARELANIRGGATMVNELIVDEQVNNGPIHSHETMV